jgi:hypothetical protein
MIIANSITDLLKNSLDILGFECKKLIRFISKLAGRILAESLPRARKERRVAQQASAGFSRSLNPLPAIRKAQRGLDKKASEK